MENKNIDNNSNLFDSDVDSDTREEFCNCDRNAEDNKNGALGVQDTEKELRAQKPSDEIKEENTEKQAEDACEKADSDREEVRDEAVKPNSAEYVWNSSERERGGWKDPASTYHFKPENMREYVSRGSDYYSTASYYNVGSESEQQKKERRKSNRARVIISLLFAALLLVSLVAGGAIGYIIAKDDVDVRDTDKVTEQGDKSNNSNTPIDMTKNDGSVNVTIGSTGYTNLTKTEVVSLVADAVVEVTTSIVQTNSFYGGSYVTSGAGSGVVIAQSDEYAYIATNYHVIDGATSVKITLTDKTVLDAEYLDGDVNYDIAMMRVKTDKKFPKIVCGSSDSLKVGEEVVAIGNPLGQLGGTVTEGIVSALDREVVIDNIKMTLLQTSAAVNPGNSGGGLFNMAGELIGIVNAKQSAEGIEGLGFAIPIDIVHDMLVEIIENGYIHGRASLGIETEYVSNIWEARSKYSINSTGVFVTSSTNDGILIKDLLYTINGQRVTDDSTYAAIISSLKIGDKVEVKLYRIENSTVVETTVEVEVVEYIPTGIFG